MIRAVLDTNIFISALFRKEAPYKVLRDGLDGKYILLISVEILRELEERLKHKFHFPDDDTNEFLEIVTLNSYIVEPDIQLEVMHVDPSDNKIVECAVAGRSHFIVSGDSHLLDLREYRGVKIITARELLSIL